jgi:hypothetical protein
MTIEDLTTYLIANAALIAVVNGRIYPQVLPQHATLPAIVYSQIHGKPGNTMENASGFTDALFQFACVGTSYFDVKKTARNLRTALEGFAGTMGSTKVYGAFQETERDGYDSETLEYRTDLDFKIWHLEA